MTIGQIKKYFLHEQYGKAKSLFLPAVLILLGLLIYSNTFSNEFVYDDYGNIVGNNAIQNVFHLSPLWKKFSTRFIPYFTFSLNYFFSGYNVLTYHIVNLLIHIGTSLVLYLLLKKIIQSPVLKSTESDVPLPDIAFFSALIFLTHPVQTAAVTSIVQRITSIATLFYLVTVWLYYQGREKNHRLILSLALLANIAAMFSKEICYTLPFMLLICDLLFFPKEKGGIRRVVSRLLPFFISLLIIPVFLWQRLRFSDNLAGITMQTKNISRIHYLLTQGNVLWTYLRLLIFPIHQNLDYDYPITRNILDSGILLSGILLITLLIWILKNHSKNQLWTFGICWFFLTLSVDSSIIPLQDVIQEYRLYLPMLGFALCLCLGIWYVFRHLKLFRILMTFFIVWCSILTYQRNQIWKTEITLWNDVEKKSPGKYRVYSNLGTAYYRKHNIASAKDYLTLSVKTRPIANDYITLGLIDQAEGEIDKAIDTFNKAMQLEPQASIFAIAYNNIGAAYSKKGDILSATASFEKAIDLNPLQIEGRRNLMGIRIQQEQYREVIRLGKEILNIDPQDQKAKQVLVQMYFLLSEKESALSLAQQLTNTSRDVIMLTDLGGILASNQQIPLALTAYKKALRLDPQYPHVYLEMGKLFGNLKQFDTAIKLWEQGARLKPQNHNFAELIQKANALRANRQAQ